MASKTTISVAGMTCSNCSNTVQGVLERIPGVLDASVSLLTEEATVNHTPRVQTKQLVEAVEDAGFDATLLSTRCTEMSNFSPDGTNNAITNNSSNVFFTSVFQVSGMTCSACTNSITNGIKTIPGVRDVVVSLLTEEATVVHDNTVDPSAILQEIDDIGFDGRFVSSRNDVNGSLDGASNDYKTELRVSGMTCSACVNTVTNMLKQIKGVKQATVTLLTENAIVVHDSSVTSDELAETVEDCGFSATVINVEQISSNHSNNGENTNAVTNMTFQFLGFGQTIDENDVINIQRSMLTKEGIKACKVNPDSNQTQISFDAHVIGVRTILQIFDSMGYEVQVINQIDVSTQIELLSKVKEIQYWKNNCYQLLYFGLPILFMAHALPFIQMKFHFTIPIIHNLPITVHLQFILGTYVQFVLGRKFYSNAYKSLVYGSGNMDVLIVTSTTIIYMYSLVEISFHFWTGGNTMIMFETSVMLFLFVGFGKWMESNAKGNTSTALSQLLSLAPTSCSILVNPPSNLDTLENVEQTTISVDLLELNDVVVILPGSKVPTDGVCIFGSSETNESLLTGESLPVKKMVGSKLIGGSVNIQSTLYMKVTQLGDQTQLQQIVKLVKEAQISKAPIQRFADYIASIFVPCILSVSLFTLIFWLFFLSLNSDENIPRMFFDESGNLVWSTVVQIAISVIVVACPCALGLAAPTAVMVGTGVGASHGILIKGGDVLEQASGIDTIIFDKTGTLTEGKMVLSDFEFFGNFQSQEQLIWSILNAIELNSEHPIAKAIVSGSEKRLSELKANLLNTKILNVETLSGNGIKVQCKVAEYDQLEIFIGNAKYVNHITDKINNKDDYLLALKKTVNDDKICSISHIMFDKEYVGYIELSDVLKPDSRAIVQGLMANGINVGMVTGDSAGTSKHVARLLGLPINNVLAEASPQDKMEFIMKLQEERGLKVSFIGDGINDAPALVQSNVGIAISSGTDIAMSAADIVLLSSQNGQSNELKSISASLDISKRTFKTIKLNFLLATIYNIAMIPIAMGVLIIPYGVTLHPMVASACMALSSVSVVLNSLSLKFWKFKILSSSNASGKYDDLVDEAAISNSRLDITQQSVDDFVTSNIVYNKRRGITHFVKSIWDRARHRENNNAYRSIDDDEFEII